MKDEGWKDLGDLPDDLSVLFIEGYCQVSWMEDKFITCPPKGGIRPFSPSYCKSFRVWCSDPSYFNERSPHLPDAYGIKRCQHEIKSGKYHAIVVVDYSNREVQKEFEKDLGDLIRRFATAGGVVAFPSSEGNCVTSLAKLFDVQWKVASYYRTNWAPCLEDNEKNINYSFGNGNLSRRIITEYSAKGVSLNDVPPHERCFGVSENSETQSMSMMMTGQTVARKPGDDNYDVVVAMHQYGKGVIAYFGDVNAEDHTMWLVSAFVESRSPKLPVDCFSSLDEVIFSEAMLFKEQGNTFFKEGNLQQAISSYEAALAKYEAKIGSNGSQKDGHIAILSNLSLVFFKLEEFHKSEDTATKALDLEWGHNKSSYRRAMARLKISQNTSSGDISRLRKAKEDVLNADPGNAARNLLLRIEAEIQKLGSKERKKFSVGFETALAGKFK